MFEMLTGRNYSYAEPGTRASELRPDIPAWLDDLLASMLAEEPKKRPWDGKKMAALIRAGMQNEEDEQKAEQSHKETEENTRWAVLEKEKLEREAAEKVVREKVLLEAEEKAKQKAVQEKAQRDAVEKATEKARLEAEEKEKQKNAKIKTEREAAKKAAREEEKRILAKKAKREVEKRKSDEATRKPIQVELQEPNHLTNTQPFFWIIGVIAIVLVIWLSSLNGSPSAQETTKVTTTPYLVYSATQTALAFVSPTNTSILSSTHTQIITSSPAPLPTEFSVVNTEASGNLQKLYFISADGFLNELDILSGEHRQMTYLEGFEYTTLFWLNDSEIASFPIANTEEESVLQIVDIKSGQVRNVARSNYYNWVRSSDISSNGRILTHYYETGLSIATIDNEGNLQEIPSSIGIDYVSGAYCLRWRPNSSIVAFTGRATGQAQGDYQDSLGVLRVGPGEYPVFLKKGVEDCISWSPDGKYIVYGNKGFYGDDYQKGIFYIDYPGGSVSKLTDTYGYYPVWSPNGSTVAFITENGISIIDVVTKEENQIYSGDVITLLWGK